MPKLLAFAAAALLGLAVPTPADAAPALAVSATHAPSHLLPGMVAAPLTITVSNRGTTTSRRPVTVTDQLPAGLTATIAAGAGWQCAMATCTRADGLPPHAAYPPIRIMVNVATGVPAHVTNTVKLNDGPTTRDEIPVRDGCPYGWAPGRTVSFAPPFPGIDSGVPNPERADGCTLLDLIWNAEPFADHRAFVSTVERAAAGFTQDGLLTRRQQAAIVAAAERSGVATIRDHQVPNSCPNRIALTFDDGTSSYRPQLLKLLRDKQVHATFFDNGVRVEQNPQWARFQASEGHIELNHTYTHIHMDELPAAADREEVLHNEAVLAAAGAPITFKGIRPPFGGSNPDVQRLLLEMGYTFFLNRIDGADWLPDKSAAAIRDDIVRQLHPGVIIGMHDGPIDTTAGAATLVAVGQIIDTARSLGYCFGVVSPSGQVVADRYVSSGRPIPQLVNPIPYHLPLAFGVPERIPEPWVRIPSPLRLTAAHSPSTFTRGQPGTLTVSVTNRSDRPGDGGSVTIDDVLPAGLVAKSFSGNGWTCTAGSCTRSDVLAPHASYPPIVITADVAGDAPAVLTHAPSLTAHGETWTTEASDSIEISR